ncbi:HCP-like protein [Neocallimastix lanati (nom. inval.)]|jgi:TPR repeat protein|uniref:HCP-like protein n=1 Tax=Neocallimastix californiae TaxID=1754190 RepID=A0A1Y2DZI0_9FUNG|nr:HCP-like protein [Neocallimastix sp. JGI-2020a]ORY64671.1 HCP-like protein [Neocallimastix californiae]|eukprot:ORY64671.1 HCP-like protein [Neocallimastix californiae]
MGSKKMGLASPPLTPPYNSDLVYKKNINLEKNTKRSKEKKSSNTDKVSRSSINSAGNKFLINDRRSVTIPDLHKISIPEGMMPVGPNGEKIPILIPDGNGGLVPFNIPKKSKKKSKSSPSINQFSPSLSDNIFKIEENKVSSKNPSPVSLKSNEKIKSGLKKAGKRQSLLIPLNISMSPTQNSGDNTNTIDSNGENSGLSNKGVPLFIIPTGPDGKIDPTALPTPMSSSELMERQREYEKSILEDNQSIITSPKKKKSIERIKYANYRKGSISSVRSSSTVPANFLKGKSKSEAGGEFGHIKEGSKRKGINSLGRNKKDNMSIFSVESNILDGVRNIRSESSPNVGSNPKSNESLYTDSNSELSSTNFSLNHVGSNTSSNSFYDEPESENNINEVFDALSTDKKNSAIILKKKVDEAVEAIKTIKDADLKYENFNYVVNNIQLLPIAIHETYYKNVLKIMKKAVQSSQHGDSLYLLGNLYTGGFPGITTVELKNFRPNYSKAFDCFHQGYKNNHQESSFNFAVCHELGLGTKEDKRKAFQIYQKAATFNHPGAMCRLGLACLNSELNMKCNLKEGVRWLRLSTMYANKNYPQAFYHLATIYERGIPNLVIRDYKYAIQLLEKASNLGHIQSQYKLGTCYEYGKLGVEVDAKMSMKYFGMAAAKGHGESMFELAGWYLTGSEVYKDESREEVEYIIEPSNEIAFQWTRKAAERNLPKAEFAIGYFYENGIGINKDPEEAMKWYYVASTHKDPKAIQKMNEKSSIFWINQLKASELPSIETEIYSGVCNYDLIEDELNLHFTTESIYEKVLNCETIKSESEKSDNNGESSKINSDTPVSSKSDKCTIM